MTAHKSQYTLDASEFKPLDTTRAGLDYIRQWHMLWLQSAIAAGTPADELAHDLAAFHSAAAQLLDICSAPAGDAPMWLGGVL